MAGPITGAPGVQLQPLQYGKNDSGNYTILTYESADKEAIGAMVSMLTATGGANYEVTESFGKSRLTIHTPYTLFGLDPRTDRVELWEFFAQHAEKDLLEASVESQIISTLSTLNIQTIRLYLQSPPNVKDGDPDVDLSSFTDGNPANALEVYQLMLAGVRSYPIEQPVIRHTITTSNRYSINRSLANVRAILSTQSLLAFNNIPNALLFNIPNDVSNNPSFAYGWRQLFPTAQQVALLKWQIVQEWQYGLWATLIWGQPI